MSETRRLRPFTESAREGRRPRLRQLGEERFRVLQIGGVEPLSEPAVNRRQQFKGLGAVALVAPEPGEAHRGAQFVASRALLSGDREGGAERILGLRWIRIWRATGELAAQTMNFCVPALRAGDGRLCQCVVQGG